MSISKLAERQNGDFPFRHYLVIEGMLLGGNSFHLPRYEYDYNTSNETVTIRQGKGPDYLPNIYHHIIYDGLETFCGLVGIRIIQFMKQHKIVRKQTVIDFIAHHFQYPIIVVNIQIDLFIQDGVIEVCKPITHISDDRIGITSRGCFSLDRLAGNLEYINLAIQIMNLPTMMIDQL